MRILFISNFYPPLELGGWEQLTQEMRDSLESRGHATAVLTSRYRAAEAPPGETGVNRLLELESSNLEHYHPAELLRKPGADRRNRLALAGLIASFKPEVIFFHSMWNLAHCLAWEAERRLPGRVVYYLASGWPYLPQISEEYWQAGTRRSSLLGVKRLTSALPLALLRRERRKKAPQFGHVLCVSRAVEQDLHSHVALRPTSTKVAHNGIDTTTFAPPANHLPGAWKNGAPAFLFVGGLYPHKGPDTAVHAFQLALPDLPPQASLTMVGSGDPDYEQSLKQFVEWQNLTDRVHFWGRVPRQEIPNILKMHDVLLVPSHYEALSRIMLEGMASELVVLGTRAWGSAEILEDDVTGLSFPPGDAGALAGQMRRIVSDKALRACLAQNGRRLVVERFDFQRNMDDIELSLQQVAGR